MLTAHPFSYGFLKLVWKAPCEQYPVPPEHSAKFRSKQLAAVVTETGQGSPQCLWARPLWDTRHWIPSGFTVRWNFENRLKHPDSWCRCFLVLVSSAAVLMAVTKILSMVPEKSWTLIQWIDESTGLSFLIYATCTNDRESSWTYFHIYTLACVDILHRECKCTLGLRCHSCVKRQHA